MYTLSIGGTVNRPASPDAESHPGYRTDIMTSQPARIAISGNTYPVKEQLKTIGASWDAAKKVWMVPADRAAEARRLVAGAPTGYVTTTAPRPRRVGGMTVRSTCTACGGPLSGYAIGRGFRRCLDCSDGGGNHRGGQSYYDRSGNFVLGDDD